MAVVEDTRRIRGEGVCDESEWRRWLHAVPPPPLALDELLMPTQRLVVVSPHPDDEVIACGGLIARHASRGGPTVILAVTDGEASHAEDPRWPAARLAAARRIERLDGLDRLGAASADVRALDLGDGQVEARRRGLRLALERVLRAGDCVVSTWARDGHPDHDATGAETAAACAAIGCAHLQAPVWMWHWSGPDDARVPWSRLRALDLAADEATRKSAAMQAHRTQLAPRRNDPAVLGAAILARTRRGAEYFFV